MFLKRVSARLLIFLFWMFMISLLGFVVAVVNDANIAFNLHNYSKFVYSSLTGGYFFIHQMHTIPIIKQIFATIELVAVSILMALATSLFINTVVLKREKVAKWFFNFFALARLIPFIIIPLIFNHASQTLGASLNTLDDNNFDLYSVSRLWLIFSGKTDNSLTLLLNFLALALTASSFILPQVYIIVARVTKQVANYPYVKTLNDTWSSYRIMRKMVMHRLIPILFNELPPIIAYFLMFVGCLEFVFGWRGVGSLLVSLVTNSTRYAIDAGLTIFILGSIFLVIQFSFVFLRNLYDYNKRKELPYEID